MIGTLLILALVLAAGMAINFPDATLDLMLNAGPAAATRVDICSTEPTNYTEATSTFTLGNVTVDGSDFSEAAGDTSGRKTILQEQTGVSIGTTGTALHLAFTDGASIFYCAITVTSQAVTSGNTATINAVDVLELRDPIAE